MPNDPLSKSFSPAEAEPRLYAGWEAAGAFSAGAREGAAPYTIMIPPPNVTGSLHIGHALTFTLQDTLIRWRRMQGRDALWQPGTDHAGIATQMVVEKLLAGEGTTRQALGREAFEARVWQWKAASGGTITSQLRRLGASLDWPRERFTLDEGLSAAVREVFVSLYEKGLIYRAKRLVNWDPRLQTAISDLEVDNREVGGIFWKIRYPIADEPDRFITVATTRPVTMLGDVAVAVNPQDERYRDLIGREAILPLVGRRIPIIADDYADPTKGSGAVKITPAHDFNDFAVGQRHNLPMPSILDKRLDVTVAEIDASLTEVPGIADPSFVRGLVGLNGVAAEKAIMKKLGELYLYGGQEVITHQVPHGDRSGVPIEPLLTEQWFVRAAELAAPAIAAVEQGKTVFVPKQWENTFFAWMRDIQPWCISRQLWWGHRIPAWYAEDGRVFVALDEAAAKAQAGAGVALRQDEDVLDTWFSSALWPFSTLGWPEKTPELARHYPTDVLVTGFDIIFFWVARMMMMGLHCMGEVPFRTVYIHGLVRDERGQKMSKSKGNVIDPLVLIERYGTDALRFAICALAGPGRDIKLGEARVESARAFVTKLWNAARFCEMNGVAPVAAFAPGDARQVLNRWILDQANKVIAEASAALEAYRFDDYASVCHKFVWGVFCDWYLEFLKPELEGANADEARATVAHVLGVILKLLHPVMPFVTEELWGHFGYGAPCSLIGAAWPLAESTRGAQAAEDIVDSVIALISSIRSVRAEMNVPAGARIPLLMAARGKLDLSGWHGQICRLARLSDIAPLDGPVPPGAVQIPFDFALVVLPLAGVVDLAAERARLARERDKILEQRDKLDTKLANPNFINRAAPEIRAETEERRQALVAEADRLNSALARIA